MPKFLRSFAFLIRRVVALLAAGYLAVLPAFGQNGPPLLHALFSNHAIVQRDAPIPVWGTAPPGATVTVGLAGARASAEADAAGHWSLSLPAMQAGGPYALVARTDSSEQTVEDVLIGDVYLCSGQSNMEWPVSQTLNADDEVAASENDRIRMLKVALASSALPLETFTSPVSWEPAAPQTVGDWSAVCYYFARELQKTIDVPLGLVNASWGGTDIRTWMSAEALRAVGGYEDGLALLRRYAKEPRDAQTEFGTSWEDWWREQSGDRVGAEPWQPTTGAQWPLAPEQLGDWKQWGEADLEEHSGMLWHRAAFALSREQAGKDAVLELGGVDEVDQTWLNGRIVGNTFGWGTERQYEIPADYLRSGENVVVVNILNTWGQGGFTGEAPRRILVNGDADEAVPLDGWRYRKVPLSFGFPPRTPWEAVGGRTMVHNAMVAPMGNYAMRGVVWYQGESNTWNGKSYLDLLRALMAQWRGQFGDDLPVLIVQLANFGRIPAAPTESGSAEVRDAQRLAALEDPNAALAVTIDVGSPTDVHPRNKQDVGRRLAQAARNVVYGEDVPPSGPAVARAVARGALIEVAFEDVDGELVDRDGGELSAFELCGSAPGSCRYATATIDGDTIMLAGPEAADAERVRYCWGDSPVCTLHDASGLPAGPFELAIDRQ